jgi:3-phosphoglycerate kinase
MVFTFYKARGLGVGSSLVEEDQLELAKKLEKVAKVRGVTNMLQICYICHKTTCRMIGVQRVWCWCRLQCSSDY